VYDIILTSKSVDRRAIVFVMTLHTSVNNAGAKKNTTLNAREQRRAAWWQKHNKPAVVEDATPVASVVTNNNDAVGGKPSLPVRNAPTLIDIPAKKKLKRSKLDDQEASPRASKKTKIEGDGGAKTGKSNNSDSTIATTAVAAAATNSSGFRLINKAQRKLAKSNCKAQKIVQVPVAESANPIVEELADMDVESLVAETVTAEGGALLAETKKRLKKTKKQKKNTYVLFLGQLPYDVTEDDVRKHFADCGIIDAVRLLTKEGSNAPRGIGYIEFSDNQAHKRGLMLHHSKLKGRQINVEFTSRGRKTERRMESLKQKNASLAKMKVPLFNESTHTRMDEDDNL